MSAAFKDLLVYDDSDQANSDQLGAHILGTSDNKIDSSTIATTEWLHVKTALFDDEGNAFNTGNPLSVNIENSDLDIRDLTHVSDSIALGDGTNLLTSTTVGADIGLDVYILNASIDVNLQDGSGNDISSTGGSLDVNITNSDLDIRDITHVSDSIKIGDGTDFLAVNTDGSINVVADAPNTGGAYSVISVTTTATALPATPVASRNWVSFQNVSSGIVYLGMDSSVTTSAYWMRLRPNAYVQVEAGPAILFHGIRAAGSGNVAVGEIG